MTSPHARVFSTNIRFALARTMSERVLGEAVRSGAAARTTLRFEVARLAQSAHALIERVAMLAERDADVDRTVSTLCRLLGVNFPRTSLRDLSSFICAVEQGSRERPPDDQMYSTLSAPLTASPKLVPTSPRPDLRARSRDRCPSAHR